MKQVPTTTIMSSILITFQVYFLIEIFDFLIQHSGSIVTHIMLKNSFSMCPAGFGKMPDFEYVFIDFLLKLSRSRSEKLCSGIPRLENGV